MNALLASAMTGFEPVSLDEMVEAAQLLTRVDRKYVLWRADAVDLLAASPAGTRVLDTDGTRLFDYESVYFDTPELLSYRLAACGRPRRFKLRTRAYLDTGAAFLEVKTKSGRRQTVKERMEYELESRRRLTSEGRAYATGALAQAGIGVGDVTALRPVITTRYRRATLLQVDGASRATLDVDLCWATSDSRRLALDDVVIVETKSSGHASPLDHALWARGHRPISISKFATGLAALHPELPANRWTRPLRRYFAGHDQPALAAFDTTSSARKDLS